MNPTYMETIWWVFKQLWDQGRVYKAHRIMPYSWKLTTPLSNFEANQNYKDVQDPTVTVRMATHYTSHIFSLLFWEVVEVNVLWKFLMGLGPWFSSVQSLSRV